MVVKKDGRREAFDRGKLMGGILRACEKRPVPVADVEKIVDDIEHDLSGMLEKEAESSVIGEYVMDHLRTLDDVAYVRFASVYRQFTDAESFRSEIEKLLRKPKAKGGQAK
jgi:transcriptional repressor NrdR